jgi:hypothetical protein
MKVGCYSFILCRVILQRLLASFLLSFCICHSLSLQQDLTKVTHPLKSTLERIQWIRDRLFALILMILQFGIFTYTEMGIE